MSTPTDPFGWDEPEPVGTSMPPAALPSSSPLPVVEEDQRFTPERAQELLDESLEGERRLAWKEALALVVVLLVVLLRFTWFG
jgi:predicted nucleic acid-binding Zn ribbon protein